MSRLPAAICGSLLSSFRYSLRWPVSTLVCKKFKRQYSQQIQNPSKFLITKLNLFNLVIRTLHSYNKIFNFKKSFRIFISCRFWICWEQCHLISIYLLLHLLSPSGDLGISLVWHNRTDFLVWLLKSSSNWTKSSMRVPQLFSGWYQMILDVQTRFILGSD